jgi:flagellar motor switch protein FliN/FliY
MVLETVTGEIARVLGTLIDTQVTAVPSEARLAPSWIVRLTFGGDLSGHLLIGFSREDANQLTRRITGNPTPPSDDQIADALRELIGQAVASVTQSDALAGVSADVDLMPADTRPATESITYDLVMAGEFLPRLVIWPAFSAKAAAERAPAPEPARTRTDMQASPPNLDVILDIDLPLAVRFGQSEMTLHALSRLSPGSVIDLGRSPDDPVDVLVNGKMIARGEVVVVAGNYGVRIIEVISAAERIRSLGA